MKRYGVFCLLFINSVFLFARETKWYEGSIVLKSKEVLPGEILVEPEYDLVLHRVNNKVDVYPAHRIQSVYFYDEEANINRRFISLKEQGLFTHHQLMEVVISGEVSIYRKQKVFITNTPSDAEGYYYFIDHQNHLIDLFKFRTRVYPHLVESSGNMLTVFMQENNLNPNSSANAITIITFYNNLQLKAHNEIVAK